MFSLDVEGIQNALPGPWSVTALKQHLRGVMVSGNSQTISSRLVEDNKK